MSGTVCHSAGSWDTLGQSVTVLGQTVKVLTVRYLVGRAGALGQLDSAVQCCPGEGWFADEHSWNFAILYANQP